MCGRFTLRSNAREIARQFGVVLDSLEPSYNIAPTQTVMAIHLHERTRQMSNLRWGLIPSWAEDPKIGNRLINARAETVAEKPSFRSAFKKGRCLIVADGFYEWKKAGTKKQPYFIRMKSDQPFAFAGLSEHWHKGEQEIDSCTIITTEPNQLTAQVHDRMPVILPPDQYDLWLDPEFQAKDKLLSMLRPYPADEMVASPVSTLVNSPRNNDPKCIEVLKET